MIRTVEHFLTNVQLVYQPRLAILRVDNQIFLNPHILRKAGASTTNRVHDLPVWGKDVITRYGA